MLLANWTEWALPSADDISGGSGSAGKSEEDGELETNLEDLRQSFELKWN